MTTIDALTEADKKHIRREAAKQPAEPVRYPDPPYWQDDELTAAGRKLVMLSVAAGNLQDFVADQLGLTARAFAKKLKSPTTEVANTWAVANAAADSALIRIMVWRATVLKDPESLKFILRIRGLSEKTAPTTTVSVDTGGKIVLTPPGISYEAFLAFTKSQAADGRIVQPVSPDDAESDAAYYAKLGITGPVETRDPKKIADMRAAMAPHGAPASCDDPVDLPPIVIPVMK